MTLKLDFHRFFLVCFLFIVQITNVLAIGDESETNGYHWIQNLENEWLIYDQEFNNYLPYTHSLHDSEPTVSLLIDLAQNKNHTLLLHSKRSLYLFIDGTLQKRIQPNTWYNFSCDSLHNKFKSEELIVTLFGTVGTNGIEAAIAIPQTAKALDASSIRNSLISIRSKRTSSFSDLSILVGICISLLAAIAYQIAPSAFIRIINPVEILNNDTRSDLYNHYRIYHPLIVLCELITSLLIAYLILYLSIFGDFHLFENLGMSINQKFSSLGIAYIQLAALCFIINGAKYLLISITSNNIFQLPHITTFHFIKCLQSSILFYGIIIGTLFIINEHSSIVATEFTQYTLATLIFYFGIRTITLYSLMNRSKRLINLHLFSYLCIVEIMPMIIAVKFML